MKNIYILVYIYYCSNEIVWSSRVLGSAPFQIEISFNPLVHLVKVVPSLGTRFDLFFLSSANAHPEMFPE